MIKQLLKIEYFAVLFLLLGLFTTGDTQVVSKRDETGPTSMIRFDYLGKYVIEAESANLDQCANGQFGSTAICSGDAWINGNVNENKAHYFEG